MLNYKKKTVIFSEKVCWVLFLVKKKKYKAIFIVLHVFDQIGINDTK